MKCMKKQTGWKWSWPSAKRSWDVREVGGQADEEVNLISCLVARVDLASLPEDPHASVPIYVTLVRFSPFHHLKGLLYWRYQLPSHHELSFLVVNCCHCQSLFSGAFIIPFLVMLLVVGMPLLLLELALGQKLRVGAARAWYKVTNPTFHLFGETLSLIQVHPALGGIGYGSTVVAGLVGCYYNVIIAWCIFYLWSSMNVSGKFLSLVWVGTLETKQPRTVRWMTFIHSSAPIPSDVFLWKDQQMISYGSLRVLLVKHAIHCPVGSKSLSWLRDVGCWCWQTCALESVLK